MKPTQQYYQNEREEMLRFVPKEAQQILEIGCGEGVFGAQLKKRQKAQVWGIEREPNAAKKAQQQLDRIFVGDALETLRELSFKFDVIICNDIIEHIVDHEAFLRLVHAHLRPGGVLVASVPNVRFLKNILHVLVHKDWQYESEGIRDNTHVRFFTKKSLARTLKQQGFCIERIVGINGFSQGKFFWLNLLSFGYLRDTQHLQFAVVARKSENPTP